MKNVHVGNDGTVFRVMEDGSISKIAKLNSSYQIVNSPQKNNGNVVLPWVMFCIALIASIILGVVCSEIKRELRETKDKLSDVGAVMPIIIKSVEIGNANYDCDMETYFGDKIYSRSSMYLTPQIRYTSVDSGDITLKVKIFDNYGKLIDSDSSPGGYSYEDEIYVSSFSDDIEYATLAGWGSKTKGHWDRGNYRIEIWTGKICLYNKEFYIY